MKLHFAAWGKFPDGQVGCEYAALAAINIMNNVSSFFMSYVIIITTH